MTSSPSTINGKTATCIPHDSGASASSPKGYLIDEDTIDDINGYIHGSVNGFYEKYFERKSWSAGVERIVQAVNPKFHEGRWTVFPQFQTRSCLLEWLWRFQSDFLKDRGTQYRYLEVPFCNSGQGLVLSLSNEREKEHGWANVQVIGELSQDMPSMYKAGLLRLCRQAQEVFASQPTRRFLHGFYILADMMGLWVFDRSGIYSCEVFDISKRPDRFLTVIAGYLSMNDEERGVSTLIKEDGHGKYILCRGDDSTDTEKLYLDEEPIAFRKDKYLISDGLTCYRARSSVSNIWEFVVKLKWRSAEALSEMKILDLIKERKVWGVVQPFSHQDLDSIENLRQGLVFGATREFSSTESTSLDEMGPKSTHSSSIDHPKANKDDEETVSGHISTGGSLSGILKFTAEIQPTIPPGKVSGGDEPFENRIFSCTVVSPIGRPLHTFKTISELLEAFRDGIKGHRSLYQVGKILHQDISDGNILITSAKLPGDPKGILIDMDMARELGKAPSKDNEIVGTTQFMSIGILTGPTHTCRDDLESFFYVFLWVIICERSKELPKTSRLQDWTQGNWFQLGQKKIRDMQTEQFDGIISEFPQQFETLRGLAKNLHQVLFPIRNGELWTGTDATARGTEDLYNSIISAFDVAIASCHEL